MNAQVFLLEIFRRLKPFLWLVPGFLLYAAYPPMAEKMDVLFALAPLMWLSRRGDARISARRWFAAGFVFWLATLSWMPAIVKNGGPWPLVVLGWGGLAAYCSLYFGLYGWLSARYWQWASYRGIGLRLLGVFLVEPILWCGLELVRSRFLGGFAWNQLGVVPANAGFGAPAAIGGVYLLSAVVILINGSIAGIVERVWQPQQSGFPQLRRWGSLETVGVFAVVFGLYGLTTIDRDSRTNSEPRTTNHEPRATLKLALVQRNFPCVFKASEENPYEVYEKLIANPAALNPELVVLPESAMSEFGVIDRPRAAKFAKWLSEKCNGAAVLAGGTRFEGQLTFNSAALYEFRDSCSVERVSCTNSEPRITTYDKVHLVPFGEFIPGDKWFPVLQKLAPVGSCTPGKEKLLTLHEPRTTNQVSRTTNLGLAICFEDTDSALMRSYAALGAEVLIFITNDSWFSHSVEAEQHAWQSVLRAIETGLSVVRVGNSGITGTITPDGRCSWLLGDDGKPLVDRRAAMFDRIELRTERDSCRNYEPRATSHEPRTPYVRLGDWPLGLAFTLLILGYVLIYYKTKYEKRRYLSM